jgi:hypothetical protein
VLLVFGRGLSCAHHPPLIHGSLSDAPSSDDARIGDPFIDDPFIDDH